MLMRKEFNLAVLVKNTEELKNQACMEDGTAVSGVLSAVGGGLLTPENKSTIRATDRQTDRQTIVSQT